MESSAELQSRIQVLLLRLPLHALKGLLVLLESLVQAEAVTDGGGESRYDFSDLVGRLSWDGDAVAVQRELRDEW
jgi:hypothetical protein